MKQKQFVILGLGIFGSSLARQLSKYNCEVIAVDKEMVNVEQVSEFVTQAIQADFTDIEQLKTIDISDCDAAVVATGSSLETSIFAVMNLKELGIPYVIAKAKNRTNMNILLRIGADKIVRPEKEMGENLAKTLLSSNIIESLDIDEDYSLFEVIVKPEWVGKSLRELGLRKNFQMNVIAVRRYAQKKLLVSPDADYVIAQKDQLLAIMNVKSVEDLEKIND